MPTFSLIWAGRISYAASLYSFARSKGRERTIKKAPGVLCFHANQSQEQDSFLPHKAGSSMFQDRRFRESGDEEQTKGGKDSLQGAESRIE